MESWKPNPKECSIEKQVVDHSKTDMWPDSREIKTKEHRDTPPPGCKEVNPGMATEKLSIVTV